MAFYSLSIIKHLKGFSNRFVEHKISRFPIFNILSFDLPRVRKKGKCQRNVVVKEIQKLKVDRVKRTSVRNDN